MNNSSCPNDSSDRNDLSQNDTTNQPNSSDTSTTTATTTPNPQSSGDPQHLNASRSSTPSLQSSASSLSSYHSAYPFFINGPPPLTFALPPADYQNPSSSNTSSLSVASSRPQHVSVDNVLNQSETLPTSSLPSPSSLPLPSSSSSSSSSFTTSTSTATATSSTTPSSSAFNRSRSLLFNNLRMRINSLSGSSVPSNQPNGSNQNDSPSAPESSLSSSISSSAIDENGALGITRRRRRTNSQDSAASANVPKRRSLLSPSIRNRISQVRSLLNVGSSSSSSASSPSSGVSTSPSSNQSQDSINNNITHHLDNPSTSSGLLSSITPSNRYTNNTDASHQNHVSSSSSSFVSTASSRLRDQSNTNGDSAHTSSFARFLDRSSDSFSFSRSRFFPSSQSSASSTTDGTENRPSNTSNSPFRLPFPSSIMRPRRSSDDHNANSSDSSLPDSNPYSSLFRQPADSDTQRNSTNPRDSHNTRQNPNASTVENQASVLAQLLAIAATATAFSLMSEDQTNRRDAVTRNMTEGFANFNSPNAFNMGGNFGSNSAGETGTSNSTSNGDTNSQAGTSDSGNETNNSNNTSETSATGEENTDGSRTTNPLHHRSTSLQAFIQELRSGLLTSQLSNSLQNAAASGSAGENGGAPRPMNYMRVFQLSSNTPRVENGVNMVPVLIVGVRSANADGEVDLAAPRSEASMEAATEAVNQQTEEAATQAASNSNETSAENGTTTAPVTAAGSATDTNTPSSSTSNEEPPRQTWVVYVFGGTYPEDHPILQRPSILSDNPTYEDLLDLEALMGQARPPVATTEEVSNSGGLFYVGKPNEICEEDYQDATEINHTTLDTKTTATDTTSDKDLDNDIEMKEEESDKPSEITKEKANTNFLESSASQNKATLVALRNAASTVEGTRCLICLSDFEFNEECRLLRKCHHSFHKVCIDKWLTTGRNSCPTCRSEGVVRLSDSNETATRAPGSASDNEISSSV